MEAEAPTLVQTLNQHAGLVIPSSKTIVWNPCSPS